MGKFWLFFGQVIFATLFAIASNSLNQKLPSAFEVHYIVR